MQKELLETRSILHSYDESGIALKLEVLFDQKAVEILKPQHTAQIRKIKSLIDHHDNIQLFAC